MHDRDMHNVDGISRQRLVVIIGLLGLAGAVLLWIPSLAQPERTQPQWETVLDEDFEVFPGQSWQVVDNSDADGGEYYWGRETFTHTGDITYTNPITALWSVGGGADGISLTAGISTYVDNVDSWALYGPLDLSQAVDARLEFDWWLDTASGTAGGPGYYRTLEAGYVPETGDWLGWCVLTDREKLEDCDGTYVSGSSGQWLSGTLSLKPHTGFLGTVSETQSIWIAFRFVSDGDGRVGFGAFLDNVALRVNYGYKVYLPIVREDPTLTPSPTPTPTPTPTPSAVDFFDSFNDSNSGWTKHEAACCLVGCDDEFGGRTNMEYKYSLYYEGGRYHTYIPTNCYEGGNHGFTRFVNPISFAPGIKRPSARTCIQMEGSFEKYIWASSWGIVFAASNDMSTNYSFWVEDRGDWGITKRTEYLFPGPNHGYLNEYRELIEAPAGGHKWPANVGSEMNKLRVEVGLNTVEFYMNGYHVFTLSDPWYVNEVRSLTKVGIIGGDLEWGDTQIGYDYFFVDEGCDTY